MDRTPRPEIIDYESDQITGLFSALRSPEKKVRGDAARQLGQTGPPAIPGLLEMLRDPDWVVRYRVVEALAMIPDPRVDPVLLASLEDRRDHVRYMSAKSLGIRKMKGALAPLISHLRDDNEFVRMQVARTIAVLGDSSAIPDLEKAMSDEQIGRVAAEMRKAIDQLSD